MPSSTGWRTDTELYPTPQAPRYFGNALVTTFTEADVRAQAAVTDLTSSGSQFLSRTGYDVFGFTPLAYLYAQGFVAYDFDPLINPADPTVTYAPQIPFDDPDTARPDWLGNVLGDPAAGVIFENPQGTLATDRPVEIVSVEFPVTGQNTTLPPPAALHWWQVDPSVVWHDGLGWHAESIPANSALAAAGAAPHHLVTTATQPFLPGNTGYYYEVDLSHEVFTFADLRTDNTLAAAVSIDPSTTDDWGKGFTSETVAAGFPITAQLRYRNPRYRLLFKDSPLRQHPRDDTLGGTPRQGRHSRSVQASTRQGWVGTYR